MKICFFALLVFLWALFTTCTGLTYWSPARNGVLGFTISPLEWTAFWCYVLAHISVAGFFLRKTPLSYGHLWCGLVATGVVFMLTAWILENLLFFNAHDPEKAEGPLIIIGGCILTGMFGILSSALMAGFLAYRLGMKKIWESPNQ